MINKIYHSDCVEGMDSLPDESADICITSPVYKDEDGYNEKLICDAFYGCYRVLKNNSLCFVNFGHLAEDKFRPFRVCQLILEQGFKLAETFTWIKNHYRPIQGNKRVNNLTEFIFMFYKGNMPKLDRLAIGVPYKDKTNAKRFAGGRDLKCRGNSWEIPYDTIQKSEQKLHNDRFPLQLPIMCLKLSGLKKGCVLEPFAGSGTTCVAAKQLGLDFVGFELNPDHIKTANERLSLV